VDRCRSARSCRCEEKSFSPASVCDRVVCDSLAPFRCAVSFRFPVYRRPSLKGYEPGLTLSYDIRSNDTVAVAVPRSKQSLRYFVVAVHPVTRNPTHCPRSQILLPSSTMSKIGLEVNVLASLGIKPLSRVSNYREWRLAVIDILAEKGY